MKIFYQYILSVFILFTISSNIYSQPHSIISYNIRYDNNWDIENSWKIRRNKISQILVQYSPSIIGIQEGLLNQVQYIDSSLIDYDYVGSAEMMEKRRGNFVQYILIQPGMFYRKILHFGFLKPQILYLLVGMQRLKGYAHMAYSKIE